MGSEYAEVPTAFGKALRDVRREVGLTQEELSERSGLDRTYVSGTERGTRNPTLVTITRLSRALGVSPAQLMRRAEAWGLR
jgi:transcriptional regulator with XRE-family HTH domain